MKIFSYKDNIQKVTIFEVVAPDILFADNSFKNFYGKEAAKCPFISCLILEPKTETIELKNGLIYKLVFCGEYVGGEYPTGGIKILRKHGENWHYVDNSPNEDCALNFLVHAERLQN